MSNLVKAFHRTLFLLPCLVSVVAAAPQLPLDAVPIPPDNSYSYAAKRLDAAAEDLFTRAITGRFNDDAQADVVVRRRSSAQMFVNPTSWDAALAVPGVIRGMAKLTGSATTGRDELLLASNAGLRAWTRDSASGAFVSRSIGNDLLWAHVELLIAVDLDSQFGDDIVGIAPGGGQALVLMAQAGGTFGPELVFALPVPPLALVACDFGGTGSKQLVFLGTPSVRTYTCAGVPLATFAVPGSAVATVLRKGTGVRQRVAWITAGTEGDTLRVLDAQLGPTVLLGNIDAVGIARIDLDHDGDDDLAVSHRAGWDLRLLTNVAGAFDQVDQQQLVTGPSGPAASNSAWPAVADLDGDMDEDVFIPVQATERIFVNLGGAIEHRAFLPELEVPVLYNNGSFGDVPPHGYLQVAVRELPTPPEGATHVELVVWRKFDVATPTDPLPDAGWSFRWEAQGDEAIHQTGTMVYDYPGPSVLFWSQRYVEIDPATEQVVRVFPSAIHGFMVGELDSGGEVAQYLISRGASFHSSTSPDPNIENTHSRTTSTIIQLVPIVDFDEDVEPGDDS